MVSDIFREACARNHKSHLFKEHLLGDVMCGQKVPPWDTGAHVSDAFLIPRGTACSCAGFWLGLRLIKPPACLAAPTRWLSEGQLLPM